MCIDYTDLNKACPKDSYLLPSIDQLVDEASEYRLLSLMDTYLGYNQVKMDPADEEKTAFMTDGTNYCHKFMLFGLKNAGAMYQRLMGKVFAKQIGKNVDDMVVKSDDPSKHPADLQEVLGEICGYNMRLNSEKRTFGVQGENSWASN